MSIYAIGDVQGCFAELQMLVEKLEFNPKQDQLWFTGDLVNRGPHSLETLRYIRSLGKSAVTVLGNHDLHLLAVAAGVSTTKRRDTFHDVLHATDRDELLDWLKNCPLIHRELGFSLIHAGLPPQWSTQEAARRAAEVEAVLRSEDAFFFFKDMYGDKPDYCNDLLTDTDRMRFTVNCLTRLRYCWFDGRVEFKNKGAPGTQSSGLIPWFDIPYRQSRKEKILFGHWSTLGFYAGENVFCLDTGCLWGGSLTAIKLDHSMYPVSIPSFGGICPAVSQ